jgi:hypothetical protein
VKALAQNDLNNVPAHQQPYPFWFWNWKMDHAEIRRQLGLMRDAGMTEVVIHGRTGLKTPFLSDDWFEAFAVVVEEAVAHGMRVWIYDEYNWPSGTAAATITADPKKREHYFEPDGTLVPEMGAELGPLSVDYLNADCTREYIAKCYQPYFDRFGRYFGNVIAGFFNDEPRFANPYPWSPSLKEPRPAPRDYYKRLGELVVQNHFRLIREWCDKHGALFTGHGMGEETLGSQTRYMGNSWEMIRCYHQPGVDHLGRATQGLHPRIGASIAHLTGNRLLTCETFAGCPWESKPEDLYRIAGWLYANGVTRVLFHGFFYTKEGEAARDWPPDLFFRWSGWNQMPAFIAWAGRVQYFLSRATPVCRVGLYYPIEEFQREFVPAQGFKTGYYDAAPVGNKTALDLHLNTGELMNAMIRHGIDFDLVPRQHLDTMGGRILVIPHGVDPKFSGTQLAQKGQSPEECIAQLDKMLGRRVRVTGPGAAPHPLPVSPRLSDPYMHEVADDEGVWVKQFTFQGRSAILLWNANNRVFDGECDLCEKKAWSLWTPSDGMYVSAGTVDRVKLHMQPCSMIVAIAE